MGIIIFQKLMIMKMKRIISIVFSTCIVIAFFQGCDSMDDNYKQYLGEYNYSGKITNLRSYPGYERVILAWDNPIDQKSKSIKIIYGTDSTVITYDNLVDSVSIEGLNAGTGYDFIVYTMDANKNLSVPTSITAFPISQAFVGTLTPPSVIVQVIGADQYISFVGLSNVLMKFGGNIEFSIIGANNFSKSGKVDVPDKIGSTQIDVPVSSLGLSFLTPGEYEITYKVSAYPIMGGLTSIDPVWIDNTMKVNVRAAVINLMTISGSITESNNNSPAAETVINIIDNDPNTKYLTRVTTAWMMWKMNRQFAATKYTITSANDDPTRDPKDWVIEASNDGINWVIIDKRVGIPPFPSRKYKMEFIMMNKTPYYYYRMNVTANNGSTSMFQIADWILYYDSGQI